MIDFEIEYADTRDGRIVRREIIAAADIDCATARAVETCPDEWFVAKVAQADVYQPINEWRVA